MAKTKLTGREAKDMIKRQREYRLNYDKEHYKTITIKFNKDEHSDVLQKLSEVPNKTDYIASLIRADIVANGIED